MVLFLPKQDTGQLVGEPGAISVVLDLTSPLARPFFPGFV